jgi:hypothetical protein
MQPVSARGSEARLKRAELLSSVGAGILGAGLALFIPDTLAPYKLAIVVLGLMAHAVGMFLKHRAERATSARRIWWAELLYWLCWLGLAALLMLVALK